MDQTRAKTIIKCHYNNIWKHMCIKNDLILMRPIFNPAHKKNKQTKENIWYLYHELVLFLQSRNCFRYVPDNEIKGDILGWTPSQYRIILGSLLFLGMSRTLKNIKALIGVFSLCEIVVTNQFFNILNTSPIYNYINTICIYSITFAHPDPILIISQTNISWVNKSVFHVGNGAN